MDCLKESAIGRFRTEKKPDLNQIPALTIKNQNHNDVKSVFKMRFNLNGFIPPAQRVDDDSVVFTHLIQFKAENKQTSTNALNPRTRLSMNEKANSCLN